MTPSPEKSQRHNHGHTKAWLDITLRYILPCACSVVLIWWLFKKVDFHRMMEIIRHGVTLWPILIMMLITTTSHIIRGQRWGIQLNGVGVKPTRTALSVSIFGCYALNMLAPRLGEVWRCIFISRRQKVPLSTVVGTLVGDRASDIVVVVALIGLTFAVASPQLHTFLTRYPVGHDILQAAANPWLWAIIITVIFGFWSVCHWLDNYKVVKRINAALGRVWQGFKVLFSMHHKWLYVWLTFGIWICYYNEVYESFLAFDFTRELLHNKAMAWGLKPGLVVFVLSSISMCIPSNGGLGPWNLAVIFGLTLFGVGETDAAAFAMLVWTGKAITLVFLGIFSMIYISTTSKKYSKKPSATPVAVAHTHNSHDK